MQRHLHDPTQAKIMADKRRALLAMDLDWGRRMFPGAPDADIEIAMHKARYHLGDLPLRVRMQSAQWLRERNLADALGQPIPSSQ